ncbi:density-regulated protein DRP1 [Trichuris suis]|nr:density-regulated protein DRP1 [Trichuris suis]
MRGRLPMSEESHCFRACDLSRTEEETEYPVKVHYCGGKCILLMVAPVEYCEYGPSPDRCREWMKKHLPILFAELSANVELAETASDTEEKKRQKRGGKAAVKPKKLAGTQPIILARAPRGKNKFVTIVSAINLKIASKYFAQKFACGSSVTGPDEIVIQGDVKDDLFDLMPEKWPQVGNKMYNKKLKLKFQIDHDAIEDIGDQKR